MKKILLFILAVTCNSAFANDKFGDWEVGLTSGKGSYVAAPIAEIDNISLVFFFKMSLDCEAYVHASIRTNTSGDVEMEQKDKTIDINVDDNNGWSAHKVNVSKDGYFLRVGLAVPKESDMIQLLKKGNRVKLKVGEIPTVEFSLKGASKALSTAENKCKVAVATDELLK